jgi:hypothetical protein
MIKNNLTEGLFENDLQGLIIPLVSLYEYAPKIKGDAIVLAFFAKHLEAAEDLSIFIEKSAIDEVLDTEVSSAPNEDGDYLIFVELSEDTTADTIMAVIDLCEHLCDVENWKLQAYKLPKTYDLTPKNVAAYLAAIKSGKIS